MNRLVFSDKSMLQSPTILTALVRTTLQAVKGPAVQDAHKQRSAGKIICAFLDIRGLRQRKKGGRILREKGVRILREKGVRNVRTKKVRIVREEGVLIVRA